MPLLTAKELEKAKQDVPHEKITALIVEKVKPLARGVVRMFHPDSTDRAPITCDFELEGEKIKLVRGVAEVPDNLVPVLEKSGWIPGKKLDKEWGEYNA
jgi:hypothetical protein